MIPSLARVHEVTPWLLVEIPNSVTAARRNALLIQVSHIAFARMSAGGATLFLRNNRMIKIVLDPCAQPLLRRVTPPALWPPVHAVSGQDGWSVIGDLVINEAEVTCVEFDVPLATNTLPQRAAITTTFHGEHPGMAADEEAQDWWVFAHTRGKTLEHVAALFHGHD